MRSNKRFTPTLLAAAMASAVAAQADESLDKKNHEIEMIEVVGRATVGMDSIITLEQLQNRQANNLADIFRGDASVSAGGSVGMGQKIYVRNIGEDMLNITVDGAEQAGAVFHHSGRVMIEPELLKQVAIEAGAGSATAGPGALGGSVRFTTKDPIDLLKRGQNVGSLLKATSSSNGERAQGSATVFGRDSGGVFSAMASFATSDQDTLEDGNGDDIVGTEAKRELGYIKAVAYLTEEHYLSVSYEKLEEDGDVLYKPEQAFADTFYPNGRPARNLPEPTIGTRETTILNYGFDATDSDLINLSLNVFSTEHYQEREYSGTAYDGSVESVGATLQNISLTGSHKLIYGLNYRDDESVLYDVDFASPDFEESGEVKGIYLQDVITVNDQLTVSAGIRFDDYELNDVNDQEFSDSGFSPNLSANYVVTESLSLSAGYAEALRGPEVKDAFKLSSSSNAADLEAEKAKNTELGMDFSRGAFGLAAGIYRSTIENPIAGATPWARVSENLEDDIETDGYYIRANYQWDKLSLVADFHSADSELDGQTVTRYVYGSAGVSKGDTLVLKAEYQFSDSLSAGWSAELVKGIHGIDLSVGGEEIYTDKQGYGVHDIYVNWQPLDDDTLTLNLAVKNLFDKQYLDHASLEDFTHHAWYDLIKGSPEAGRDISLSASLRF